MDTTFQLRRGTTAQWVSVNPVLKSGEPGYEIDTGQYKLGNGGARWLELPYFLNEDGVAALIGAAVLPGGGLVIETHVNDLTPHPVYDDIVSMTLLFENGLL